MVFQNKNVLVTGGAGFIGSSLVRELIKRKANVFVYDNLLMGDVENLKEVEEDVKLIEGNILDSKFADVLSKNEIDFLFHLAAEPYIPECYDRPRKFFEVNANGTLNVMLACKKAGVKRIVQYSSSEIYGTAKQVPMDEFHPIQPFSTYAVSKLAADSLCFTLHHEHGLPVIILRQFNCYGPRETHPYIIPELFTQLKDSNKLNLGNIKSRRDLTYVEDAAKAAIELMKYKSAEGKVFNAGYGKDWSVEELANIIAELFGHKSIEINIEKERLRPLDVERLFCNYFKLHKLTGWSPKTDLRTGLSKTLEWFKGQNYKWIWEKKVAPEDKVWKKK